MSSWKQFALGFAAPSKVREVIQASLRELRWGAFPGLAWLTRLFDALVLRAGAQLEPDLLLFRKILLTLEGVLGDLLENEGVTPGALIDQTLLEGFWGALAAELPERLGARFDVPSSRTQLSMADWGALLWSAPFASVRWWSQANRDWLCGVSKVWEGKG